MELGGSRQSVAVMPNQLGSVRDDDCKENKDQAVDVLIDIQRLAVSLSNISW